MPDASTLWTFGVTIALFIISAVGSLIFKRQDKLEEKVDRVDEHLAETREDMKENYASRADVRAGFDKVFDKLDQNGETTTLAAAEIARLTTLMDQHLRRDK